MEYFELVALRRIDRSAAQALRKAPRGKLFATGMIAAFLLTVPLINLLTPVVATEMEPLCFRPVACPVSASRRA